MHRVSTHKTQINQIDQMNCTNRINQNIPDAHNIHIPSEMNTDTESEKSAPQSKNLSSVIRGFKSAVTTRARKIDNAFAWQPRFYDRIIRNEDELNRVREYIFNNPQNWLKDENNL